MQLLKKLAMATLGSSKFVPDPAARDVFLASYPRSGNTWLRAIVFAIEMGRPPDSLTEIDYYVPDGSITRSKLSRNLRQKRFIVKTHNVYQAGYRKFVYVIRNPINSLESYYRFQNKMSDREIPLETFAADAVCGRIWPCPWDEHVVLLDDGGTRTKS